MKVSKTVYGQNLEKKNPEIEKIPKYIIPKWTKSRIGQNPELDKTPNRTKSRIGQNPEWTKSRMDEIPNWTKSRVGQNLE